MKRWAIALFLFLACASAQQQTFAVRLRPGDDLRGSLEEMARAHDLKAGYVITCAGSLTRAAIRYAGKSEVTFIEGPLEIVSLTGTLSPDGPHLHISVSDAMGRTSGGHLAAGSIVYTTAEIIVGEAADVAFTREIDEQTKHRELVIRGRRQ